MNTQHFITFALTALLLNLTPGNDMLFVIARSVSQGIKAGIVSSLGIMSGCTIHLAAAIAGLSVILSKSAMAFELIKYIGAGYLIYLGIQSFGAGKKGKNPEEAIPTTPYRKIFLQAALTNILNPKVALFFLAFLPQFVDIRRGNTAMQILFLGIWFDLGGTLVNIGVSFFFGRFGRWISGSSGFVQWQKRITGCLLIALGIKMAVSARK